MASKKPLVIGGVIAAALLAVSQLKPAPKPVVVTPKVIKRDLKEHVETVALEVDANGYVLGAGIVVQADWTPDDAKAHCQSKNSYILWKSDSGSRKPDRGWKWDGTKAVPPQPYKTWTLDNKNEWVPDVAMPADADTVRYYYVAPDVAKGETKGSWNSDPQKMSPPETGPPLVPPTYPQAQKAASRQRFLLECSIDAPWNIAYCTTTYEQVTVAGGGAASGGGGGAGGLVDHTGGAALTASIGTITDTIGAGGAGIVVATFAQGGQGSDTTSGSITAVGGGGGGAGNTSPPSHDGSDGGSGGGSGASGTTAYVGGSATQGTSAGGTGYGFGGGTNNPLRGTPFPSPGGGGAGAVGAVAAGSTTAGNGGAGRGGYWNSSGGSSTTLAGGGAGASFIATGSAGTGGVGGGGNGNEAGNGSNGSVNTGSGGGSCATGSTTGSGGSGVIHRKAAAGALTVTISGGTLYAGVDSGTNDVWITTASGSWQITAIGSGVNHSPDFFQLIGQVYFQQYDAWDKKPQWILA